MERSRKEKEVLNKLSSVLPGIKFNSIAVGNKNSVFHAAFFTSEKNRDWVKSAYQYSGELKFIHFTKLRSLKSIIKEQVLRLYNLNKLNDPREYSYAGDILTLDTKRREDAKRDFYLLSMCKNRILKENTQYEFNLWRLYGDNGKGVAIEIGFENRTYLFWQDYFLSEVYYGDAKRLHLKEINKFQKSLQSEDPTITIDLARIACFHKSMLFGLEKEIRLLFDNTEIKGIGTTSYYNNKNELIAPIIENDKEEKLRYLKLPIWHRNFKEISGDHFIPIPSIKRIILGYAYKDNFTSVSSSLSKFCNKHLGYVPIIQPSRLTKYYHDYFMSSKSNVKSPVS